MCLIWDKYIKNSSDKEAKLPIIYPLIFYHGRERPYPYSCDLLDCFDDKGLAKEILQSPVQLIDVTRIPDEELKNHGTAAVFELLQKHIFERDMQDFLRWVIKEGLFQWLRNETDGEYLLHVLKYTINQGEIQDVNKFLAELTESMPNEEEKIMTMAEQLRQQGMQQGMQQEQARIVVNLYRTLKDEEKVAELSGLSLEKIKIILKEKSSH